MNTITGANDHSTQVPLLEDPPPATTPSQKAVRKAFKGTAHLANLLPTGSVLAFQLLSPTITRSGHCRTAVRRGLAMAFLALCASFGFLVSFTDSFRNARGKVRYGFVTLRGIWPIDGSPPPEDAAAYRLRAVDVLHAVLSVAVFAAVAMLDGAMIHCLFPSPSEETLDILAAVPVVIGMMCSLLFILFPTNRHGVGFPLSRDQKIRP